MADEKSKNLTGADGPGKDPAQPEAGGSLAPGKEQKAPEAAAPDKTVSLHPETKATYDGGAFRGNQHDDVVSRKMRPTTKSFAQDSRVFFTEEFVKGTSPPRHKAENEVTPHADIPANARYPGGTGKI